MKCRINYIIVKVVWVSYFQHLTTGIRAFFPRLLQLTSHWFCWEWFLSWISQSCWPSHTAQWCMVMMTGRVNKAPGGPQLTTGPRTVWPSSTKGLKVQIQTHTHCLKAIQQHSQCMGETAVLTGVNTARGH